MTLTKTLLPGKTGIFSRLRPWHYLGFILPSAVALAAVLTVLLRHEPEVTPRLDSHPIETTEPRVSSEQQAVMDAFLRWKRAIGLGDSSLLSSSYSHKFTGRGTTTREKLLHDYARVFQEATSIVMQHHNVQIRVYGNRASLSAEQYVWAGSHHDYGVLRLTFTLESDGVWRIVEHHWRPYYGL